jgi:molybdate/tungstate transport system permease protein
MPKNFSIFRLSFLFFSSLILLFIIAPLAGMFLRTSGHDIAQVIGDKESRESIWLTLSVSFITTLLFSLPAIPLAYVLAKSDFPGRRLLNGIVDLPIVIPHSAAGIALLGVIARGTLVGNAAESLGIGFIGTPFGIGLAMAYVSLPYLINAARDGFSAIPERLEKAALSLGASRRRTFFEISLPLAKRSIFTGMILMFARGMSEFGAVIIIAYHPSVTPVLIYDRFASYGLNFAQGIAVVFITITLIVFVGLSFLSSKKEQVR